MDAVQSPPYMPYGMQVGPGASYQKFDAAFPEPLKPPATMPLQAPMAPMQMAPTATMQMAPMQIAQAPMMASNAMTIPYTPPAHYYTSTAPIIMHAGPQVQQQAQPISYYVQQPHVVSHAPQVYSDFGNMPGHTAPPKEEKYELPDAWQLYPCGPWKAWWSGHVPIHGEYAKHTNHGVALNEMVVIPKEQFGLEWSPYDASIRNIYWNKIGSCGVPDYEVEDPEGKRRGMALTIREYPGLASAYDFKGKHDPHTHYAKLHKYRKEKALNPEYRDKQKSIEIFDDEALAELFSDPEALLEREFKIDVSPV